MSKYNTRFFPCDCGWPAHALAIDLDEEDGSLIVYVANHRYDHSLRNRIKDAWRVLRGSEHALSEVIIPAEDVDEFVEYIGGLKPVVRIWTDGTGASTSSASGCPPGAQISYTDDGRLRP